MTDISQANDTGTAHTGTGDTTTDKFKSQFASLKSQATDKARDYAGQGVGRATGALDEAARFLEDTARTIEEKVGPQYGRYGFSAAESVSGFAEQLRGKDMDELIEDVRGLVRKSPGVAIGAAVGLGFVLARLAKAGAGYESAARAGGASAAATKPTSAGFADTTPSTGPANDAAPTAPTFPS